MSTLARSGHQQRYIPPSQTRPLADLSGHPRTLLHSMREWTMKLREALTPGAFLNKRSQLSLVER
jgi:hypothetical protein